MAFVISESWDGIRNSSVSIVTGQDIRVLLPSRDSSRNICVWPIHLFYRYHGLFGQRSNDETVKPSTHLHLVSKIKMRGAVPPLPHITSWNGTVLSTETAYLLSQRLPNEAWQKYRRDLCAKLQHQYSPDIQGVSLKMGHKQQWRSKVQKSEAVPLVFWTLSSLRHTRAMTPWLLGCCCRHMRRGCANESTVYSWSECVLTRKCYSQRNLLVLFVNNLAVWTLTRTDSTTDNKPGFERFWEVERPETTKKMKH